ncbi:MAG TPA: peptidase E [Polyangiaceae bacterium]|nr:peptidase E [Polyangiaceae bacterium]
MKQIVAMGGGGFLMENTPLLDDFILSRAKGRESRVCFIATASGDSDRMLVTFYTALGSRCRADHLPLFRRSATDVAAYLLNQDVIYVGGGNTANLLALWRLHGVDRALVQAYEAGIVLCGVSAGALCWFEAGVTDSFGSLDGLENGLGILKGSFCPHFDGEPLRRPAYRRLIAEGMQSGFAADDGAAMCFVDGALAEVVTSRPSARAYRVGPVDGALREEALPSRYLGGMSST